MLAILGREHDPCVWQSRCRTCREAGACPGLAIKLVQCAGYILVELAMVRARSVWGGIPLPSRPVPVLAFGPVGDVPGDLVPGGPLRVLDLVRERIRTQAVD